MGFFRSHHKERTDPLLALQAMTCSFESPFLICIQTTKEDAKGSEKPSLVRSGKRTALYALTVETRLGTLRRGQLSKFGQGH